MKEKVWGLVLQFRRGKDANKFIKDYDKLWFTFNNEEYRENLYKKFLHEACTEYGECDITRFSSTGKTDEELKDWIITTFL